MGQRTRLYIACLVLFPIAFAGFVVGFACPVWMASSARNNGLWQICRHVFKSCTALDFNQGGDWMIGVRAVEILALVLLAVAGIELAYENCCTDFRNRKTGERIAPGFICCLGGAAGLAGIIVYAVKTKDDVASGTGTDYGWALMILAAGSGLAFLIGVGLCVSGCLFERLEDPDKIPMSSSQEGEDGFEMSGGYTNRGLADPHPHPYPYLSSSSQHHHSLPAYALYNGGPSRPPPPDGGGPFSSSSAAAAAPVIYHPRPFVEPKSSRYFSYSGEEALYDQYDFSEGYPPSRPRGFPPAPASAAAAEVPQYPRDEGGLGRREPRIARSGRAEDPYYSGGLAGDLHASRRQVEEAYSRYPGAGGGFGGGGGGDGGGRNYEIMEERRDVFYRSPRY